MTDLRVGNVVMYKPTRPVFAVSTGSWTGKPAFKSRPCVIVNYNAERQSFTLAPLCGAQHTAAGWTRRNQMDKNWWHPVYIVNGDVQIPPDGATVPRKPIALTHDPHMALPSSPKYKPSYIWAGDAGEEVPIKGAQLRRIDSLSIDQVQIDSLEAWWKYWLANNRPSGP
ncbi:hypothetical protein EV702DRAFT_1087791 [Suillus placidus]|uniref:Uncharacterized protein n=1 Tax=Suillus placidus TaxID=48579 RepID=A0A9P6ZZ52_9AGAM|nr:hypothetical protein EV702DRAFT_1087791 [Suillus placidus]